MFKMHERLHNDTIKIGSLQLCEMLLMNDSQYPWIILVPRRADISEMHQLSEDDQQQLMRESVLVSSTMQKYFNAKKMNVAALGNIVPQLHIHHIARYENDIAWPKPVWGVFHAIAYSFDEQQKMLEVIRNLFVEFLLQ